MRVIAGLAKGRKLLAPPANSDVRPITDRGKESLFNILASAIVDNWFLDLFAGTGSVGIEALSRGAAGAVFVEQNPAVMATIRRNVEKTGLDDRAELIRGDAFRFLAGTPRPFKFVFVAPQQYQGLWTKTLTVLDEKPEWIADDGMVIVQIDRSEFRLLELRTLTLRERRQYGSMLFCFYGKESNV